MKVELLYEPCDVWIGFYWDRKKRILYFLPVPCVGFKFIFKSKIKPDKQMKELIECFTFQKTVKDENE